MNRRKSTMGPSEGGATSEKKLRSPFAAFRKDSAAREQLPDLAESPERPRTHSGPRDIISEEPPQLPSEPQAVESHPRIRHKPQPPIPRHSTFQESVAAPIPFNSNGISSPTEPAADSGATPSRSIEVCSLGRL